MPTLAAVSDTNDSSGRSNFDDTTGSPTSGGSTSGEGLIAQPIAEVSEEQLRSFLDDLSVPTLLVTCVHLAADDATRRSILDGPLRPAGSYLNEYQGFMSDEDQVAARQLALEIIADWRDRGAPTPEPISPELLKELMEWIVGMPVGDEYVPMMTEELALDGRDDRAEEPTPGAQDLPVVVIGCGMSGLLAAIRLGQAGHPYVVLEKNDGPGGTWWENRYPGARVDVGSHFYCYSFEPSDHWSEFFARQPELQAYFERVMDNHGVRPHVRFGVEATDADWDEERGVWVVSTSSGEIVEGRALLSAVGMLNRPFVPEVEGDFDGPAFHTARWRDDVDLTDRDVVMIGAGATGFQVAPAIAEQVRSLTVLQRSAQWMFPNLGYHDAVGDGVRWAIANLPYYGRWFRFLIFFPGCDTGLDAAIVDPDYVDAEGGQRLAVSEINEMARGFFADWIIGQVDGDPDLVAKVVPDYPPTGKRTLQDNGSWLRTLTRGNVELVRAGVERLEPDGVVDSDGVKHRADVVVWATGFCANDLISPLRIRGRGGVDLHDAWARRPRALLGITVPEFPNFFMLYGPGTNLASGGSIIFSSECQVRYVMGCLRLLAEQHGTSIEPTTAAYEDWFDRCQERVRQTVWASPHIAHSYYKADDGEVYVLNPWRLVDYWTWTREPNATDYVVSAATGRGAST